MMKSLRRLLLSAGGLSAGVAVLPAHAGLVASLAFDGDLLDSSGNGNHGFFSGGSASYEEGSDGTTNGALTFDGVDDLVILSQTSGLPLTDHAAFSITGWVRGAARQNDRRIFSEASRTSARPLYTLGTPLGGATDKLDIFVRDDDSIVHVDHHETPDSLFDRAWHHFAVVDDEGVLSVYIDGVAQPGAPRYVRRARTVDTTTLGGILRAAACCHFAGALDDVRLFDQALTEEEVAVLANPVVTTSRDSIPGSLRQLVNDAPPGTHLTFAEGLSGGTLVLEDGEISIPDDVEIDASSLPQGFTVKAATHRVFEVTSGADLTIRSLTIADGSAEEGGGIRISDATVVIENSTLTGNTAERGGGIFNAGDLTLNNTTISGNRASIGCGPTPLLISQEVVDDFGFLAPWQSFTAPATGELKTIENRPNAFGGISGMLKIYEGEGTGGVLLHSQPYAIESVAALPWQMFELNSPIMVEAGQLYTWELTGAVGIYYAVSDLYAGGRSSNAPWDFAMRIHIDAAVEAPQIDIAQEQADDFTNIPPWQSFTAVQGGALVAIETRPNAFGGISGSLRVYAGTGTGGTLLHTQPYAIDSVSGSPWQRFDLIAPITLETGQVYTWELAGISGIFYADTDVYAGGEASDDMRDMTMRIHVAPDCAPRSGGGIFNEGTLTLNNVTVSDNTAEIGGGISSETGLLTLNNSIVAGNSAPTDPQINGPIAADNGSNLTSGDPFLAPLGDYGGPTVTMLPVPFPGSPVIDAGGGTILVTDQRGMARSVDGDSVPGTHSDLGAAEFDPNSDLAEIWTLDFDNDGSAFGVEHALGTNPFQSDRGNANNVTITTAPAGEFRIAFGESPNAFPGTEWVVRRSIDLISFVEIFRYDGGVANLAPNVDALIFGGGIVVLDQNAPEPQAFYLFEAESPE